MLAILRQAVHQRNCLYSLIIDFGDCSLAFFFKGEEATIFNFRSRKILSPNSQAHLNTISWL